MDQQFIPEHVLHEVYESHLRQLKICRNWPSWVSSQHHACCKNEKTSASFTCSGRFRWTPNLIIMQCASVIDLLLYEIWVCKNCKSGNLMIGFVYVELFGVQWRWRTRFVRVENENRRKFCAHQKLRFLDDWFQNALGTRLLLPSWDTFLGLRKDFWWHFNYFSHHRNHKFPQQADPRGSNCSLFVSNPTTRDLAQLIRTPFLDFFASRLFSLIFNYDRN